MIRYMPVALAIALLFAGCGGGGDAAGTYVLDKENIKAAIIKQAEKQMGGTLPEAAMEMVEKQAAAMQMEVTLNGDGTFEGNGKFMNEELKVSGTYEVDGEKITIKTTEKNGEKQDETAEGTLKDGEIRFKPEADMPFELVLKKK